MPFTAKHTALVLLFAATAPMFAESHAEKVLKVQADKQSESSKALKTRADVQALQIAALTEAKQALTSQVAFHVETERYLKAQLAAAVDAERVFAEQTAARADRESRFRARIADQDNLIQSLQKQIATAHVQIASANGAASGSRAALKALQAVDPTAVSKEVKQSIDAAAQKSSKEILIASDRQASRSALHAETLAEIRHQGTMSMRLLVLLAIAMLIQFSIILVLIWKRR